MDPERYQRVFEIFIGVCYLPPEERGAAIARACGDDRTLRRDVEAFLSVYDTSASEAETQSAAAAPDRKHLEPGTVVSGAYRIDELIGVGGMGTVYRATDLGRGRPIALKVVAGAGPQEGRALKREALAIARLAHPNIVAIHEFGDEPGVGPYLVMELLGGRTLDEEIASRGRFGLEEGLRIMDQTLAAVEAAHAAGVIHCDLKPQNVMLEPSDGDVTVKVLDFGLARLLNPNTQERDLRSFSGALVGTPHFMCPEQCDEQPLDARSDVYGLGCLLYAVVAGRPPFEGDSLGAVLLKHLDDAPRPPSDVVPSLPPELDAAVLRALAKRPADRFQSVAELRAELARIGPGA